jgi:hypothetical protein
MAREATIDRGPSRFSRRGGDCSADWRFRRENGAVPLAARTVACLLATVLGLTAGSLRAQEKPTDKVIETLDGRVKLFLEEVKSGKSEAAYEKLLSGSQLLKQTDGVKKQVAKTDELEALYGQYKGFERIADRRVGNDLVLLRYLYKCERFPVVWYFAFYRTPETTPPAKDSGDWRVILVRFDTNLEALWDATPSPRP